MKVEQFMNLNQFHLYGKENGIYKDILQSYNSKVVEIEHEQTPGNINITLGCDWDYSTTTSKHVYAFLEEFANMSFAGKSNKRAYIQKLIDNGVIKYDESMC